MAVNFGTAFLTVVIGLEDRSFSKNKGKIGGKKDELSGVGSDTERRKYNKRDSDSYLPVNSTFVGDIFCGWLLPGLTVLHFWTENF